MPADVQNASATGTPKTCFVIMGFGKKTDYGKETRTLDLDATYRAILKWMLATMANTLYAMGQTDDAKTFEQSFRTLSKPPAQWSSTPSTVARSTRSSWHRLCRRLSTLASGQRGPDAAVT